LYNEVIYFLPIFIGGLITVLAFQYKNNILGVFGGLFFFLYGVALVIVPLPLVSDLINIVAASISWGFGAWLMYSAAVQEIDERGISFGS